MKKKKFYAMWKFRDCNGMIGTAVIQCTMPVWALYLDNVNSRRVK